MLEVFFEILVIVLLILLNGFFSMSEIAVVSSRKAKLAQQDEEEDEKTKLVLSLKKDRDRFLATVQIGITLISIIAGAFSGATLAGKLSQSISQISLLDPYSESLALLLVVIAITYCTLIFGELIPKKIALNNPEKIAKNVVKFMILIERIARPAIYILTLSSRGFMKLLGLKTIAEQPVSEDEIRYMVEQGTIAGVIAEQEHVMVDSVFRLGDRMVSSLMTPRAEVDWLDTTLPLVEIKEQVLRSDRSRFPLCSGGMDKIIGVVKAKDVLALPLNSDIEGLKLLKRRVLFVPENKPALDVLKTIQASGAHFVVVVDEYGEVIGIVTLTDILEAIVGEVPAEEDRQDELQAVERDDGSWLIDGMMSISEFKDLFEIKLLPGEENGAFQTIGGLVMAQTGDIPSTGDVLHIEGLDIEVVDMDSMRVDKVLVKKNQNETPGE